MAVKKPAGTTSSKTAASRSKNPVRKSTAPRKPAKASGRRPRERKARASLGHELKKVLLGIGILLAVCLTTAMVADIFLNSGSPVPSGRTARKLAQSPAAKPRQTETVRNAATHKIQPKPRPQGAAGAPAPGALGPVVADISDLPTKKKTAGLKVKNGHPFVYEVFEEHAEEKPPTRPEAGVETMPQIAIIIDDIGYDKKVAMGLFDLNPDITFSVLPFSPFGKTLAGRLSAKGAELMLHLPMEPRQYPKINPGPGALLSSMAPDTLLAQLRKDLSAVPGVVGVNNHMGSQLTAQADQMNQIFTVLKKQGLFFIDSRTAPDSKGEAAARLFRLRFSQRDVFLDNFQNVEYITGQLEHLVKIAAKHGTAIGIGHPYPATLETLSIELPRIAKRVKVVRASRLVAIPG